MMLRLAEAVCVIGRPESSVVDEHVLNRWVRVKGSRAFTTESLVHSVFRKQGGCKDDPVKMSRRRKRLAVALCL